VREQGITYTAAGRAAGISKARVSQLRKEAPPARWALFGVGPITIAIPLRATPERSLPVISAEDSLAAERMSDLLRSYGFTVEQFRVPVDGRWTPTGDVAYLGRLRHDGANLLIIAGIHAIGSLAAIEHLTTAGVLDDLHTTVAEGSFSCVIRCTLDGEAITSTDYAIPPRPHP
jgi:hypothetical protein